MYSSTNLKRIYKPRKTRN